MAYNPSHLPMVFCASRTEVRERAGRIDGANQAENATAVLCRNGRGGDWTIYYWDYNNMGSDDDSSILQPTASGGDGRWVAFDSWT